MPERQAVCRLASQCKTHLYQDRKMKKLFLIFLALSLPCTVQAAEGFSTLEERMSGKEFKETGLGKLRRFSPPRKLFL